MLPTLQGSLDFSPLLPYQVPMSGLRTTKPLLWLGSSCAVFPIQTVLPSSISLNPHEVTIFQSADEGVEAQGYTARRRKDWESHPGMYTLGTMNL
jgi:hypothetical protein